MKRAIQIVIIALGLAALVYGIVSSPSFKPTGD
jgi:hypothetical protein